MATCDVCSKTLRGDNTYGVCRTEGACRDEYQKRRRLRHSTMRPCEVCGRPVQLNNTIGICHTTSECRAERRRRTLPVKPLYIKIAVITMSTRKRRKQRTCLGCGGPVSYDSATGFCRVNADCTAMAIKIGHMKLIDTDRKCLHCSGPIQKSSMYGYCRTNDDCVRLNKLAREYKAKLPVGMEQKDVSDKTPYERIVAIRDYIEYNRIKTRLNRKPCNGTLPDDGHIDEIAVYLAYNKIRAVSLTNQERELVMHKMLKRGTNPDDLRFYLRTSLPRLRDMLKPLGWEIIPDPHQLQGALGSKLILTRIDRPRTKLLTAADMAPLKDVIPRSGRPSTKGSNAAI